MSAGQVFWLSVQPVGASLPTGVCPGSGRADALALPVPDHSGGTAPDLHRVPGCLAEEVRGLGLATLAPFVEINFKPVVNPCQGKSV